MRFLVTASLVLTVHALAQQAPVTSAAPASALGAAASPVPNEESHVTGSLDLGYRWRSDVGGSFDSYRTFVNFGSGPKLLGGDFTITDPARRLFDRMHVRLYNIGGDPYQTVHVDAEKSKLYEFTADYRDIAYFDFLPSFADPLLSRGTVLNEQSFDTHRKIGNYQLDLLPGNWITPYFSYEENSSSGTGATVFFTDTNQFPVPSSLRDSTNLYRGGLRFELRRFHATLEQGGTTFKDDQQVYQSPGSANYGNVAGLVLGQSTYLNTLLTSYGIRGHSIFTRGLFTADPALWLDLYGEFLYSQPATDANYQQNAMGNLLELNPLLLYTAQSWRLSSTAKLPHSTASFGAEIHPTGRLRVIANWLTDRLHNSGAPASYQTLANSTASYQESVLLNSALVNNYNQADINLFYDVNQKLMVRGGYRYVWGNASDSVLPPAGLVSSDSATLRRNVGLAGLRYQPVQRVSLTAETEIGSSGSTYFATSLSDYQKVRAQARYQALNTLSLTAGFTGLINQNPASGINWDYRGLQESVSMFWNAGKIGNFQGSYTRSTMYSDIRYLDPGTLQPQVSLYRDNAHTITAQLQLTPPTHSRYRPTLTLGGSFFISSGSRPTNYYQPVATLRLPVTKQLAWFGEWRYYGYGEAFYLFEGFRAHLVTTGVRFTR